MKRFVCLAFALGCHAAPSTAPVPRPSPAQADRGGSPARSVAPATPSPPRCSEPAPPDAAPSCSTMGRFDLGLDATSVALPAGRWVVSVTAPKESYVTLGVAGPTDALKAFEVFSRDVHRLRTGTTDDDGRLPAFVSFETTRKEKTVLVIVDVEQPVRVLRSGPLAYEPPKKEKGTNPYIKAHIPEGLPLVGLPFPIERRAGYVLSHPHRYQFARADVVAALRAAFKQTRIRFKRSAIAVGDISQWNGIRPATDLGKARHISHQGGRDVDIGLPMRKGASTIENRCDGVLVESDVLKCAPGTVKGVDGMRLAYFLGLLIDGPTPGGRHVTKPERRPGPIAIVDTIFTDQAYIDEVRKALPELRKKRWIHDEAYSALMEEGLLRPSPWHVDHVHIRFKGPEAVVPKALDSASSNAP